MKPAANRILFHGNLFLHFRFEYNTTTMFRIIMKYKGGGHFPKAMGRIFEKLNAGTQV